mgnify:CR=1 FL=1
MVIGWPSGEPRWAIKRLPPFPDRPAAARHRELIDHYIAALEDRDDKSLGWEEWVAGIAVKRGIPMKRLGRPEEPARALVFLASPMASFTTGAALDVSGGFNHHL